MDAAGIGIEPLAVKNLPVGGAQVGSIKAAGRGLRQRRKIRLLFPSRQQSDRGNKGGKRGGGEEIAASTCLLDLRNVLWSAVGDEHEACLLLSAECRKSLQTLILGQRAALPI